MSLTSFCQTSYKIYRIEIVHMYVGYGPKGDMPIWCAYVLKPRTDYGHLKLRKRTCVRIPLKTVSVTLKRGLTE